MNCKIPIEERVMIVAKEVVKQEHPGTFLTDYELSDQDVVYIVKNLWEMTARLVN
ncbi:hypothetical protein RvY_05864 [Ramazzottius varieornatus]|uniref:Uncharacterized protein n=1 Tax=Ramazzottius varieornatus TaxID=947166 RepID=A0A1D1UWI1_RAMVA|nr:hypothetical protein RvY_05864 [Ramazzottius varieornatus]